MKQPKNDARKPGPRENPAARRSRETEWTELGDVIVSFGFVADRRGDRHLETRAFCSQSEEARRWDGIAGEELLDWILAKANTLLEPGSTQPATEPASEPERAAAGPPQIEFVDLGITQIPAGQLRASGKVKIGAAGANGVSPVGYRTEFVLDEVDTGNSRLVGMQAGQLSKDQPAHDVACDFPVPPAGRYNLKVVVRAGPRDDVAAESKEQPLRVVA